MSMGNIKLILHALRDLWIQVMPFSPPVQEGFAFLVHPRDDEDVYIKYPFFRHMPKPLRMWILRHLWPVVLSRVEGMRDVNGKPIPGWILTLAIPPSFILKHQDVAIKKIIQAISLAHKLGAEIFGLGAFTSSITKAGSLLTAQAVPVTSGHTYTALVTIQDIKTIIAERQARGEEIHIAIVGATGSIGSTVSRLLMRDALFDSITLIGRTKSHMERLLADISTYDTSHVKTSYSIHDIGNANIIIVTTSAVGFIISPDQIMRGVSVYDITQPKNIDPLYIQKHRQDIHWVDGGLVALPPAIRLHFNFRIPPHTAFACLAETMLIAAGNLHEDFTGPVSIKNINLLEKTARSLGFVPYANNIIATALSNQ